MSLRFKRLRLNVETESGPFGTTLEFDDGLNILRGENTIGKSTCIMSLLYGLGLEGMMSPKHRVPFPEAVTDRLQHQGEHFSVHSSTVEVTVENRSGNSLVVKRDITGSSTKRQMVTVLDGVEKKAFFVRTQGAAQREAGFHKLLAEFMSLHPPLVPRYEGPPVPLYQEAIFPFFFVEQLSGWRAIEARMPTHFGIESLWKTAVQFVLGLSGTSTAQREYELQQHCAALKKTWHSTLESVRIGATQLGLRLVDPPKEPSENTQLKIEEVTSDGSRSLDTLLDTISLRLIEVQRHDIPTIRSTEAGLSRKLDELEQRKADLEQQGSEVEEAISMYRASLDASDARINELEEDLRKYKDINRLRKRGADLDSLRHLVALRSCPTCQQDVDGTLLDTRANIWPMTTQANAEAVQDRLALYRMAVVQKQEQVDESLHRRASIRRQLNDVRGDIREIRRDLSSHGEAPSAQAIRERVLLEERKDSLERFERQLSIWTRELSRTWSDLSEAQHELSDLKKHRKQHDHSSTRMVALLQDSFLEQLQAYGYRSHPVNEIEISDDTYRPIRHDVDLGGMSASDNIRVIWAYLVALLEVARQEPTNHQGFLILDEPQQQQVADFSFKSLLQRCAGIQKFDQQVIFATSEKKAELAEVLPSTANVIEFGNDFVIKPLG